MSAAQMVDELQGQQQLAQTMTVTESPAERDDTAVPVGDDAAGRYVRGAEARALAAAQEGGDADESSPEPEPTLQQLVNMARVLGVDVNSEYYLFPVIKHALETAAEDFSFRSAAELQELATAVSLETRLPGDDENQMRQQSKHASLARARRRRARSGSVLPDPRKDSESGKMSNSRFADLVERLVWFRRLIENERERNAKAPIAASPWVLLSSDGTGHPYYYNCRTQKRADKLPSATDNGSGGTNGDRAGGSSWRDAAGSGDGGGVTANGEVLEMMRFTAWWTEEGSTKRYVHINYDMRSEDFLVVFPDTDKAYRLRTLHGQFGPMTCWDLRLHAKVHLFGRPTTLMQCDYATRVWIEANVRRLMKLKRDIQKRLSKYEIVKFNRRTSRLPPAQQHLRALMKDVAQVKARLAHYRPRLAGAFLI